MNVIFTGITGVRKRAVITALIARRARALQDERKYLAIQQPDPDNSRVQEVIKWTDVDRHYGRPGETVDVEAILVDGEISQVRRDWKDACDRAVESLADDTEVIDRYLAVHATYFFRSRPSIPVDVECVAQFHPDAVVTLIDDAYSVWWRVKQKDELAQRGSYLRLQDVLKWRQFDVWLVEQVVSDLSSFLQSPVRIPHYLLAVKHPVETLYRLLYEPSRLRIYAARPMTDVRGREDCLQEIQKEYEGRLREGFTVIEPGTVDEAPLQIAFHESFPVSNDFEALKGETVRMRRETRLPLSEPMVPDEPEMFEPNGLELDASEVLQAAMLQDKDGKSEIDLQIYERDFWLVRMSHRVAGYRPYWSGVCPSGSPGVINELNIGARLRKLPRYVELPEDRPGRNASPLDAAVQRVASVQRLVVALENDQAGMPH